MFDIKVKLLVIAILLFCIYQYHSGRFTGINYRKLIIDFVYFSVCVYVFAFFKPFQEIWYIDIVLSVLLLVFSLQLIYAIKVYIKTNSFEINPTKRLLYLIEQLVLSQKWVKCYRMLRSHSEIVNQSAELTLFLGDAQKYHGEYEDAFESFAEASEYSLDEKVVLQATEKGFLICCNELNNKEKGFSFLEKIQSRDMSPDFVMQIDQLMKKVQ